MRGCFRIQFSAAQLLVLQLDVRIRFYNADDIRQAVRDDDVSALLRNRTQADDGRRISDRLTFQIQFHSIFTLSAYSAGACKQRLRSPRYSLLQPVSGYAAFSENFLRFQAISGIPQTKPRDCVICVIMIACLFLSGSPFRSERTESENT